MHPGNWTSGAASAATSRAWTHSSSPTPSRDEVPRSPPWPRSPATTSQLRGAQRSIQITRNNADTAASSLKLTQDRATGGLTTDLDVANAAAQLASTQSQIPTLETQLAQLTNAIALLLGEPPRSLQAELATPKPVPPVPKRVPVGFPSELARRRPDIRQAEANLHAATATIGVAVGDFYPRVTLSGSLAIQAVNASSLGDWAAPHLWRRAPASPFRSSRVAASSAPWSSARRRSRKQP